MPSDEQNTHVAKKIKVLIVDDSAIASTALSRIFAQAPDIEVVGTARDGVEALQMIPQLDPTVICTDLYMPLMDGLELTKEVMNLYPRPVLVVSVSVRSDDTLNVYRLLEAGAVDVFPKPRLGLDPNDQALARELIRRVRVLSGVFVFSRRPSVIVPSPTPSGLSGIAKHGIDIVAIGSSTGGPMALQKIISALPDNFSKPLICVQHISPGFLQGLVDWLAQSTKLKVKIAERGENPQAGTVYFAPENEHLLVDNRGCLTFTNQEISPYTPSVDVTFESLSGYFGKSSMAVLLTGMGDDGANGLLAIANSGGVTIAQDEATSVVFGMPASAIALGAAQHVLSIDDISTAISRIGR